MERTKGRDTRKRGKKRAMQLHLMSFERWIAKECVDSRINSRPFSSFLFHRRCSSTYATRSKLEFLPSISVFRHIRNETKSTGPLIIEIVRDKLSRRGGEEKVLNLEFSVDRVCFTKIRRVTSFTGWRTEEEEGGLIHQTRHDFFLFGGS